MYLLTTDVNHKNSSEKNGGVSFLDDEIRGFLSRKPDKEL